MAGPVQLRVRPRGTGTCDVAVVVDAAVASATRGWNLLSHCVGHSPHNKSTSRAHIADCSELRGLDTSTPTMATVGCIAFDEDRPRSLF